MAKSEKKPPDKRVRDPAVPPAGPLATTTHSVAGDAGQVNDSAVKVTLSFEAVEQGRKDAILRSARQLLARIRTQTPHSVWSLQEAVWPALGLPECRGSEDKPVKLTLLPLSRIGQMEGKSGSLVLIGHFSFEQPGALCSHPL